VSLWRQITTGIRAMTGRSAADRDIADEVGHYLDEAAAVRQAQGLSPAEARRAVRLDVGNAAAIEEQIRGAGWEAGVARLIETLWQDIRFSLRSLRRAPVVSLAAIATLAIGIGATTAIVGIVNAVLIRPLPYPDPDRLISLSHAAPGVNVEDLDSAPFLYFTEREATQTFESVGLWTIGAASVTGRGEPEQVRRLLVTHEILPMLGATALLGRTFSTKDDSPDTAPTAILTHEYWQRRFASDPSIVGERVTMDGQPLEIIGVMPRSFRFLDLQVDVIQPHRLRRAEVSLGDYFWPSIARLRPGVTLDRASADVARLIPVAIKSFPLSPGRTRAQVENTRLRPILKPLKADIVGDVGSTLWVLMTTVGIVLLIACANVANLLLVRTEGRQQELSIRVALGARSRRLARALFTESLVLSVAGGVAGTGLAYGIMRLVATFASTRLPRVEDVAIDSTVMLFACALTLTAGLLLGLIPVVRYRGSRLGAVAHATGRTLSASGERLQARDVLITAQVALALVLLIGGGLMLRTFQRLTDVDLGFTQPDQIQTVRIEIPRVTASEPEAVVRLQQQTLDRLAALPGVTAVAYASSLPMDGRNAVDLVVPEGRLWDDADRLQLRQFKFISPGFVGIMGTPLVAGRDLDWTDVYGMRPVVLVSESLARRGWGGAAQALGKRLRTSSFSDQWREIVGVVGDVRNRSVSQPAEDLVYVPTMAEWIFNTRQLVWNSVAYVIRSDKTGTPGFLAEVQQAVWSVDPTLPLANAMSMGDIVDRSLARTTFTLLVLLVAGAMALVLGVIGIYGVIAYAISQRTREVGVRIALGAQGAEVRRLFVRRGMVLTTVGVAIGLVAASALTRGMTALLFEVRPLDPATYAAVTVMLVMASALASYVPARRATRIDPIVALRAD
jgi:putative ABC transport system permease protein